MKTHLKLIFPALFVLAGVATMQAQRPTLYLIGDSTVRNGSGKRTDGLWGWGSVLAAHFDTTRLHIENHAIGGRSSRTFLTEGRWDRTVSQLKPGDYVLMQFGHNDGGAVNDTSRARGSIRGIGDETEEIDNLLTKKHEIVHTYGWYLKKYISETTGKGATAIVCSPVPRNVWKAGKVERSGDSYSRWAAECAAATGAFFIDLNDIIARRYEAGYDEAALKRDFFPGDHTHTNYAGAQFNAAAVVAGLKQVKTCKLNDYVITVQEK